MSAKIIPTGYDIEAHPEADVFDPIAWYEGTGEDLGLPEYYREMLAVQKRHLAGHHDQKTHGHGGSGLPSGAGTKDDPIRTGDVEVAQKALAEGKYVELDSPRQVSTLLDKLKATVDDAVAKGEKAPNYDLCKVSVPKTNLFCQQSIGIPRAQMPQLKGRPEPGTPADFLPKNAKGEVDLSAGFRDYMTAKGYPVHPDRVGAEYLKASQTELEGGKVVGIAAAMRAGRIPEESIFVSNDDYIVDGHHRWAAVVANEYIQGQSLTMPVNVIDAPITTVLREANDYAATMGLPQVAFGRALRALAEPCIDCP